MRRLIVPAALVALAYAPAGAEAADCGRFIVGEANSTAYDNGELPARGLTWGASCSTLKRIARHMNAGDYRTPSRSSFETFGPAFTVLHEGKRWSCRIQNQGSSGPSYRVRCTRPTGARLSWRVG